MIRRILSHWVASPQGVEHSVVQNTNFSGSLQEVLHSVTTSIREQINIHDVI
ncbi:hypothetical protein D3C80_1957380 [compost metagenome]